MVDAGDRSTQSGSTPLRSVGAGTSSFVGAALLEDGSAAFPVPGAPAGALGLVGLELSPDGMLGQTFTIVDNTATDLVTDPADGDLTMVAGTGSPYIGVYVLEELVVTGDARVITGDSLDVLGPLTVDPGSTLDAHNLSLP